jgi:hypothetical protein
MAALRSVVKGLRKAERELERELAAIRTAISSLEFGGGGVPRLARKRRRLSAKVRRAMSLAQKRRWAKVRTRKESS